MTTSKLYDYAFCPRKWHCNDLINPLPFGVLSRTQKQLPRKWNKQARLERERHVNMTTSKPYRRPRVLLNVDLFADAVPSEWRGRVLTTMGQCDELDWLVVTTTPDRVTKLVPEWCCSTHPTDNWWPKHVYLGAKVCTQADADTRIPHLLRIPSKTRFVWVEPQELIDLDEYLTTIGNNQDALPPEQSVNWLICTGNDKPMHPQWVRQLHNQAKAAHVPFWFDSWGEWREATADDWEEYAITVPFDPAQQRHVKFGKANTGRLLDGREWTEVPT